MRSRSLLRVFLLGSVVCTNMLGQDVGTLHGNRYESPSYRFSVSIPDGWKVAGSDITAQVEKSVPDPSQVSVLLVLQPDNPASGTLIALESEKLNGGAQLSAEIGKSYAEAAARVPNLSVVLLPIRVSLGGVDFYRTDLKSSLQGDNHIFSLIAVGDRDRVFAFNVHGDSQSAVDEAVHMLVNAVHFEPDWSVPDSEIDSSKKRVRVSMGVSDGINRSKVQPTYPEDARRNHVQGPVVLNALISPSGQVQRLWVLEGDPVLSRAAVDAVRQWTYKPYLLNGEPVNMETKILVRFQLR